MNEIELTAERKQGICGIIELNNCLFFVLSFAPSAEPPYFAASSYRQRVRWLVLQEVFAIETEAPCSDKYSPSDRIDLSLNFEVSWKCWFPLYSVSILQGFVKILPSIYLIFVHLLFFVEIWRPVVKQEIRITLHQFTGCPSCRLIPLLQFLSAIASVLT